MKIHTIKKPVLAEDVKIVEIIGHENAETRARISDIIQAEIGGPDLEVEFKFTEDQVLVTSGDTQVGRYVFVWNMDLRAAGLPAIPWRGYEILDPFYNEVYREGLRDPRRYYGDRLLRDYLADILNHLIK